MTQKDAITPRGTEVMLPHGGLAEVIPPYLIHLIRETGGAEGPIGLQFVAQPERESAEYTENGNITNHLLEKEHQVAPGLIYKYKARENENGRMIYGRALWTITYTCGAYCRFCTRGEDVGMPNGHKPTENSEPHSQHLSRKQIDEALAFIEKEPGLNEVILSGGDPLTIRPDVLYYVLGRLAKLQEEGKLDIVRIGSRLPVHNPTVFKDKHFAAIAQLRDPRLMLHINHPLELTSETLTVIKRLKKESGAMIFSQSVLLAGVNDDPDVLYDLFVKCAKHGITPYYVFQNDPVYWATHFTVPIERAMEIWSQLRPMLSGQAATARFVIDVPEGYGKIPVPEGGAWSVNTEHGYIDFRGTHHLLQNRDQQA